MLGVLTAMTLQAAATTAMPCAERDAMGNDHLSDVCSAHLEGEPAYSVTFGASLNPRPAAQQVMVYRADDAWVMRVAGYRWKAGTSAITTKRNEFKISDEDASMLIDILSVDSLRRLAAMPYYGSDDAICTDGASLELAFAEQRMKHRAAQHSCAGKTDFNQIAATFRQIAIKYDPEFETLLNGLKS